MNQTTELTPEEQQVWRALFARRRYLFRIGRWRVFWRGWWRPGAFVEVIDAQWVFGPIGASSFWSVADRDIWGRRVDYYGNVQR